MQRHAGDHACAFAESVPDFHDANKHPVGFAVWACLSEEVELLSEAIASGGEIAKLELKDWKSGDRTWLLDLVSTYVTEDNNILIFCLRTSIKFRERLLWIIRGK